MKWIKQNRIGIIKKQNKAKKDYIHANKNKQADKKREKKRKKGESDSFYKFKI